jgi:hypothetical protein
MVTDEETSPTMRPGKEVAMGIAGCVLVPGPNAYQLANGSWTDRLAVTVSLLWAEPCLRKLSEGTPIGCEEAVVQGYKRVRRYDDAIACGLV